MTDPDAPPKMFVLQLGSACRIVITKADGFPVPNPYPAVRIGVEAVAINGGTQEIGADMDARELIEDDDHQPAGRGHHARPGTVEERPGARRAGPVADDVRGGHGDQSGPPPAGFAAADAPSDRRILMGLGLPDNRTLLRDPTLSPRAKVLYLLVNDLDPSSEGATEWELAGWVGATVVTVRKNLGELDKRYPGWSVER